MTARFLLRAWRRVSTTLLAFLKTGDHLLMVDTAYHPTRQFCDYSSRALALKQPITIP